jgi:hypothetical protein
VAKYGSMQMRAWGVGAMGAGFCGALPQLQAELCCYEIAAVSVWLHTCTAAVQVEHEQESYFWQLAICRCRLVDEQVLTPAASAGSCCFSSSVFALAVLPPFNMSAACGMTFTFVAGARCTSLAQLE